MKKPTATLTSILGTLAVLAVLGLLVLFTGAYNVAATADHFGVTHWALNTLQQRSVGARAGSVQGSPPSDTDALGKGLLNYDAMCVNCHGGPGVDRGELGQGMNPTPPDLALEGGEWTDEELFWITKNGIRIAGMPAFGPTHSDLQVWELVAAMRALPDMNGDQYRTRIENLEASGGGHTHDDGAEGSEHSHDSTEGDSH